MDHSSVSDSDSVSIYSEDDGLEQAVPVYPGVPAFELERPQQDAAGITQWHSLALDATPKLRDCGSHLLTGRGRREDSFLELLHFNAKSNIGPLPGSYLADTLYRATTPSSPLVKTCLTLDRLRRLRRSTSDSYLLASASNSIDCTFAEPGTSRKGVEKTADASDLILHAAHTPSGQTTQDLRYAGGQFPAPNTTSGSAAVSAASSQGGQKATPEYQHKDHQLALNLSTTKSVRQRLRCPLDSRCERGYPDIGRLKQDHLKIKHLYTRDQMRTTRKAESVDQWLELYERFAPDRKILGYVENFPGPYLPDKQIANNAQHATSTGHLSCVQEDHHDYFDEMIQQQITLFEDKLRSTMGSVQMFRAQPYSERNLRNLSDYMQVAAGQLQMMSEKCFSMIGPVKNSSQMAPPTPLYENGSLPRIPTGSNNMPSFAYASTNFSDSPGHPADAFTNPGLAYKTSAFGHVRPADAGPSDRHSVLSSEDPASFFDSGVYSSADHSSSDYTSRNNPAELPSIHEEQHDSNMELETTDSWAFYLNSD